MKTYALMPTDSRKSFYNKALVTVNDDGSEVLTSYTTQVAKRMPTGEIIKLWDGWTATTGRHIKAFCGLSKSEWDALPMQEDKPHDSGGRRLTNAESYAAMIGRRYAG